MQGRKVYFSDMVTSWYISQVER